jgi:uncharacterized protein (TIGR02246 family)
MRHWTTWAVAGCLLAAAPAGADDVKSVPPEDPAHAELRALRDRLVDAFNRNDVDALLRDVHPNVVATWQDGTVSRGHAGIRDYYDRMMKGPQRVVDRVTILHGDRSGLAFGKLEQDFTLTDGKQFHLSSRWTADLVREGGRWVLAGFHVSANVFDNPILHLAVRKTALWAGGGALLLGLVLGALGARTLGRARRAGT